jgi:hypothetical protein
MNSGEYNASSLFAVDARQWKGTGREGTEKRHHTPFITIVDRGTAVFVLKAATEDPAGTGATRSNPMERKTARLR